MKPRLLFAVITACLLMNNQAMAFSFSEYYGEQMRKHATEAKSLLDQIQASEEETMPMALVHNYYIESCWMVYNGLLVYMQETKSIPEDLSMLADSGYVEFWPDDPVSGSPMTMSDQSDPQPGTFVIQLCPSSSYSLVGSIDNYRLVPHSFELSVIGQSEHGGLSYRPNEHNNWASVPTSAIFQVGCYTEVAATTLEKMENNIQRMQEMESETEKGNSENREESENE